MPSPTKQGHSGTILSLQLLRAVAAVCVVIEHSLLEFETRFSAVSSAPIISVIDAGVDIFFVISGFIMVRTSWDQFSCQGSTLSFWKHRVVRIVPLYFFFTTLTLATVLALPATLGATQLDWAQVVTSYFFIPYERHDGVIAPVLSPGWTLNYEAFFYFVFGLTLMLKRDIGLKLLFLFLLVISLTHFLVPKTLVWLWFWSDPIILEFAMGAAIGVLYKTGVIRPISTRYAVLSIVFALVLFVFHGAVSRLIGQPIPRVLGAGVASAILVCAFLLMPTAVDRKIPKPFVAMGDASYSLYLSHRFGLRVATLLIGFLATRLHMRINIAVYCGLVTVTCVVFGQIVHLIVERPMIHRLRMLWPAAPRGKRSQVGASND